MKYLIILFVFLAGCNDEINRRTDHICTDPVDKDKLVKFILDCAKAANPMSDEEGEDLVIQCERTGTRVICPVVSSCQIVTGAFLKQYGEWEKCNDDKK